MFKQCQRAIILATILTSCNSGPDTMSQDVVYSIPLKPFQLVYQEVTGKTLKKNIVVEKNEKKKIAYKTDSRTIKDLVEEINIILSKKSLKNGNENISEKAQLVENKEEIQYTSVNKKIDVSNEKLEIIELNDWTLEDVKQEIKSENIIRNELDITVTPVTASYMSQTNWSDLVIKLPVEIENKIPKIEIAEEKFETDTVKTMVAAAEKINNNSHGINVQNIHEGSNENMKPEANENIADDVVLYDYSETQKEKTQNNSNEIQLGINPDNTLNKKLEIYEVKEQREQIAKGNQSFGSINEIKLTKNLVDSAVANAPKYTVVNTQSKKTKKTNVKKSEKEDEYSNEESFFEMDKDTTDKMDTQVSIKVTATDLEGGLQKIKYFDIEFMDNRNEVLKSEDAIIKIQEVLVKEQNIRTAKVTSSGTIPVYVDIVRDGPEITYQIPMIHEEIYNQFMAKRNVESYAGTLLIALGDEVEDVEIDSPDKNYQDKLIIFR